MGFLKKTMAAAVVVFSLSSPALAYSDSVVLAAIDERVQTLDAELHALRIEYRNTTSTRKRKKIKNEYYMVYSRKCQLLTAAHWVKKLPESKNESIITHYHLNVASPSA